MPDGSAAPAVDSLALRETEFPALGPGIYMNAASFTPLPERTRRVLRSFQDRRAALTDLGDDDLIAALASARRAAARLVGADAGEIALGWNASYGINLAAHCLPIERGSTIVVSDREFPANVYPWMARREARLETVPPDAGGRPDEARLLERLDRGDVSIFALSSVQFGTGYRADLERFGRFCRERGIFFVVDAIQSLGQRPLDVRAAEIDVLATGGHKWLCSPWGTGFAYVRRELIQRMEPAWVGWTGMTAAAALEGVMDYAWSPRSDARRFEGGTLAFDLFAGMAESIGLLLEVGVERIAAHLDDALEPLLAWLRATPEVEVVSDLDPAYRSAIVSFRPPAAERVFEALRAAGVTCALRSGAIRVAPHLYNTRSELERVVEILDEGRATRWS